eukprot:c2078_g1_i1.p1 GENE.c2078_g1_i1~~c2078_g1_i1.p1  ORF type:complete len:341 (-),score=70.31 c2078_g1_i1:243-1265(-)
MSQATLGYLWLKGLDGDSGRDLRSWSCSLCLLRGGKLIHFDIDPKTQPKGKIPLIEAQTEASTGAVPGALYSAGDCFRCVTPTRTFHIFAETHENRNKWVNLLTDHIQKLKADPAAFEKSNKSNFELKEQIATAERVEFLTKSGGFKNISWKKRLFVLNGENLVYYELPQGLRARGNYSCLSCKSTSDPQADLPSEVLAQNLIQVETECGSLLLGALDENDKKRWMDALMSRSTGDGRAPSLDSGAPIAPAGDTAAIIQRLTEEKDDAEQRAKELAEMKDKSDKIIRALKNENKKLKQTVDDLTAQLREKDEGIQHLTSTMERMRIEVMEAHDAHQARRK